MTFKLNEEDQNIDQELENTEVDTEIEDEDIELDSEEEVSDEEETEEAEEDGVDSLPAFGDIDPEDIDPDEEDEEETPATPEDTKSLIGMLVNKKYSQLKKDIEDIVANKIAAKIQDKKDDLKANGFRSVGNSSSPEESDAEKGS
jgi:hypothetical protein